MPSILAANVLDRLDGVSGANGQWKARCPLHGDETASLSITEDGRGVALHCHAGCDTAAVLSAAGLCFADLHKEQPARAREPLATYDYVDASGAILWRKLRFAAKQFAQQRPDDGGAWLSDIQGVPRVLYRLPALLEAISAGETVYITEGEKDADALAMLGFCATTNSEGARQTVEANRKAWRTEYTESLRGAHAVILPDNDAAGRSRGQAIAEKLVGTAASVRVLELPGLAEGGDVSDWLDAGGGAEALAVLVADIAQFNPPAAPARARRFRLLSDAEMASRPALRWLVDGVLPLGGLSILYGAPESGKSFVVLDLAYSIATGRPWHGREVHQGPVVFIVAEGAAGMPARLRAWREQYGVAEGKAAVVFVDAAVQLTREQDVSDLLDDLREGDAPVLVIVDTLFRSAAGANLSDQQDVSRVVAAVDRLRGELAAALLLVHHTNKRSDDESGSIVLRASADTMLLVKRSDDGAVRVECEKQKDAACFPTLAARLVAVAEGAVLVPAEDGIAPSAAPRHQLGPRHTTLRALLPQDGAELTGPAWQERSRLGGGAHGTTFDRAVRDLVRAGLVERIEGRPLRYRLAPDAPAASPDIHHPPTSPQAPACVASSLFTHHSPTPCKGVGGGKNWMVGDEDSNSQSSSFLQ